MSTIITRELLQSWGPCANGYKRFCELFPDGATLTDAIDGLVADGHDDWGWWLFDACRQRNLFSECTVHGYQNSGHRNSGHRNSGHRNSGHRNSGDWNSGHRNSGDQNSGDWNSGDRNSGHQNSGHRNSGDQNSGDWNSGDQNSGDWNSGDRNSGDQNSGDWNSGDRNSGDQNSGDWNSGDRNSGDQNSGDWNSGDWNSGSFNVDTPVTIRVFGKDCDFNLWRAAYKPSFLYFQLTEWVPSEALSEQEKAEHPSHLATGGVLKYYKYKEAFKRSWESADPVDRMKVLDLPNFDAEIFFQISGIDLRDEVKK